MNDVMTQKQVAEMLKVSLPTVRKAVRERGLPHVRIGRNVRFRRSAIEAWLEQQEKSNVGA